MVKITDSITINKPLEKVFAYLADMENLPQWQSGVVKSKVLTPGPTRVGTKFTEEVKVGKSKLPTMCEIIEFVPNKRIGFVASSSAIGYQGLLRVEKNEQNDTNVNLAAIAKLKGFYKLLMPIFSAEAKKGARKELNQLKKVLEG